jgi:hypothetical protein
MRDSVGVVQVILSGKDESLASAMKKAENDVAKWKKSSSASMYGWSKDAKKNIEEVNSSFKNHAATLATVAKGFVAVSVATKAFQLARREITEIIGGMRDAAGAQSKVSQEMKGQAIIAEQSMKTAADAYDKMNQNLGAQLAPVIGFIAEDIAKIFTSFSDGLNLNEDDLEWFAGVWGTIKTEIVLVKSVMSGTFNFIGFQIANITGLVGLLVKGIGYLTFSDTLKDFGENLKNISSVLYESTIPAMGKAGVEFRNALSGNIIDQTQKDFQKYSQNMVANAKKVGEESGKEQAKAFAKSYQEAMESTAVGGSILAKQAEESAKSVESAQAILMPLLIELDALRVARGEIAANESIFSNQEAEDARKANEQKKESIRLIQEQIEKTKAMIEERKILNQMEKEIAAMPYRIVGPDGVVSGRGYLDPDKAPASRGTVAGMQSGLRPSVADFQEPIDMAPMIDALTIFYEAMNDVRVKSEQEKYRRILQISKEYYTAEAAMQGEESQRLFEKANDPMEDPEVRKASAVSAAVLRIKSETSNALYKQYYIDKQVQLAAAGSFLGDLGTLTEDAAKKNRAFFYINKAFGMAQAEVNAWLAFTNIMASPLIPGIPAEYQEGVRMAMASTALAAGQVAVGRIAAAEMGGRAAGGAVLSGGLYEVNERGPEMLSVGDKSYLMMGNKSGMVTPNAGRSPAPNVTVNIHTQPGTTARTESGGTSDQPTLEVFIEQIDKATAAGIRSGTSATSRAMQQTYGVNRARGSF